MLISCTSAEHSSTCSIDWPSLSLQAGRNVEKHEGGERDDDNEGPFDERGDSEASESAGEQQHGEEDGEEGEEDTENPWETLTGAKAKAKVKFFQERHWVATEIFYANLAAATERLEAAARTQERG